MPRCSATIAPRGGIFTTHNQYCSRGATVQRGDQWYCAQHDPAVITARRANQLAKSSAKFDRQIRRANALHVLIRTLVRANPATLPESVRSALNEYTKASEEARHG